MTGLDAQTPAEVMWIRCPSCDTAFVAGASTLERHIEGQGYIFKCCGTRHHLDPRRGGAETWMAPHSEEEA